MQSMNDLKEHKNNSITQSHWKSEKASCFLHSVQRVVMRLFPPNSWCPYYLLIIVE
jgi:hypothetical protein